MDGISRGRVMRLFLLVLGSAFIAGGARSEERLVHTYSIVARDKKTGQIGVAVQSHWFSVGPVVPWAEAGVGAVATQSLVKISYGPHGLDLMRKGLGAKEALEKLVAGDSRSDVRQVAIIDSLGRVDAHTGSHCIESAGHHIGDGYSVQANLMLNDSIVPAMSRAYEAAEGDLAGRMLAALSAAQKAGGDIRGRQSAALLVVSGDRQAEPWQGREMELRVEDHPNPVKELRRLAGLHRAYEHSNRGDELVEHGKIEEAMVEYAEASRLAPAIVELKFWQAVTLFSSGNETKALRLFKEVFDEEPIWVQVVPRVVQPGFLPDDPKALKRITDQAR